MQKAKAVKKTIVKARLPKAVREKKPRKPKAQSVEAKAAVQGPIDDLEGLGRVELTRKADEFAEEKNFVLGPLYMRCAMKAAAFALKNARQQSAEERKLSDAKQVIFDPLMIEANNLINEWRRWEIELLDEDIPVGITYEEANEVVRRDIRAARVKLARVKDLLERADAV